jgi:hypothetical protein
MAPSADDADDDAGRWLNERERGRWDSHALDALAHSSIVASISLLSSCISMHFLFGFTAHPLCSCRPLFNQRRAASEAASQLEIAACVLGGDGMDSERYGTFTGRGGVHGDPRQARNGSGEDGALISDRTSSRVSRLVRCALALSAVGAVAALAWTGAGVALPIASLQAETLSVASSAETTTDVERQFLSGVDRGRLRDFQHKYSR